MLNFGASKPRVKVGPRPPGLPPGSAPVMSSSQISADDFVKLSDAMGSLETEQRACVRWIMLHYI